MKQCSKCGELKSLDSFGKNRSQCKSCVAEYMREYYKKNPDKALINRSKQKLRDAGKDRFTRHRITIGQYDEMVAKYDGKCWSCKERAAVVIDHDHRCCSGAYSCGKCVRGVLCSQCNTSLGLMRDDEILIKRLLEYCQTS
jgi:hypothetical protein